jgi:predicted ATP-grasp superfamily ATP-dependent carboligase
MSPRRALVTDAGQLAVVAAIRALVAGGFEVTAAASGRVAPGQWSRMVAHKEQVPDPGIDPGGFASGIERVLRERSHDVMLVCTDAALLALAEENARIDQLTRHGIPSQAVIDRCLDKWALVEAAEKHGIQSPETRICRDDEEVDAAVAAYGTPVMVKPRRSLVPVPGGVRHASATLATDANAVRRAVTTYGVPVIVQKAADVEAVYSYAGAFAGGRMLGVVFARYARTWPPGAGNASFAETCLPSQELGSRVRGVVEELGWEGVFELELLGLAGGGFAAIDFNPRVYGSLALPVKAGANLPALWGRWLCGDPVPDEPVVARPGYRYRLEEAELRNLFFMLKEARLGPALDIVRPRHRVAHAYFRWEDPGPLVGRVVALAEHRLTGRAQAVVSPRSELGSAGAAVVQYTLAWGIGVPMMLARRVARVILRRPARRPVLDPPHRP